jgi:hypothetical protein
MGDFVTEGFLVNDILNPSSVLVTSEIKVLVEDLEEVLFRLTNLNPRILFVSYGTSEMLSNQPVEMFIQQYSQLLDEIQRVLPDTIMIINGIIPSENDVLEPGIEVEFNEELRQLAYGRRIAFLDKDHLVREESYMLDVVYFPPQLYQLWAESMRGAIQL